MFKSKILLSIAILLLFIGFTQIEAKRKCTHGGGNDDAGYGDSDSGSGGVEAPDDSSNGDSPDSDSPPPSSGISYCKAYNRPSSCTGENIPVCAHIENCTEGSCNKTMPSACEACSDSTIDYHVPGECPIIKTICDPNNQPTSCPGDWEPVCVYLSQCTQSNDGCFQTAFNPCEGCDMATAVYHTPGEC